MLLRARAFDGGGETSLLTVCRVAFDDTALAGFIYRGIRRREELLGTFNIFGGERLGERLSRIMQSALAAQIKHMLPSRGADSLLC